MFDSIPRRATRLVAENAHRQDKHWYAAHKAEIDELVYRPLRALLDDARAQLARSYPRQTLTTRIFRIHRDVRFSRDKSPFKDHASGVIMVGPDQEPGSGIGALYVQIGPDEGAAAGRWMMNGDVLGRYRRAVLHERHGGSLEKLLAPLTGAGFTVISAAQLTRAPRGVDPLHARSWLLRHKGLALDFPPFPAKVRHSAALLEWCVTQAKAASPVIRWLLQHT